MVAGTREGQLVPLARRTAGGSYEFPGASALGVAVFRVTLAAIVGSGVVAALCSGHGDRGGAVAVWDVMKHFLAVVLERLGRVEHRLDGRERG